MKTKLFQRGISCIDIFARINNIRWRYTIRLLFAPALFLASCQASPGPTLSPVAGKKVTITSATASTDIQPASVPTNTPVFVETQQLIFTPTGSETMAATVTPTLKCPRTIIFYGDSRLGALGVSFVEDIKKLIGPCYNLVNASFWAHTAKWGLANLQDKVISRNPDDLALWWGANDFNGCNGTSDPITDLPDMAKFNTHLNDYLSAMKGQIEMLASLGKPVYIFDEPRVNGGKLPWAIVDSNGKITGYDHNHLCSWNWVSDAVAQAQKQLVTDEVALGHKVFLVDVWQLYMDDGTLSDMYSTDVVHPGSVGREKIAALFMNAYLIMRPTPVTINSSSAAATEPFR